MPSVSRAPPEAKEGELAGCAFALSALRCRRAQVQAIMPCACCHGCSNKGDARLHRVACAHGYTSCTSPNASAWGSAPAPAPGAHRGAQWVQKHSALSCSSAHCTPQQQRLTSKKPLATAPRACTTRSGMRSRSNWANFSTRW